MSWNNKNKDKIQCTVYLPGDTGEVILNCENKLLKSRKLSNRILDSFRKDCVHFAFENYSAKVKEKTD